MAEALAAEGVPVSTGYKRDCRDQPLFLEPEVDLQDAWPREGAVDVDYGSMRCPNSEWLCREETMWIGQSVLLADRSAMDGIAEAIEKVSSNRAELMEAAVAT